VLLIPDFASNEDIVDPISSATLGPGRAAIALKTVAATTRNMLFADVLLCDWMLSSAAPSSAGDVVW
jgi:hypothetical protein